MKVVKDWETFQIFKSKIILSLQSQKSLDAKK